MDPKNVFYSLCQYIAEAFPDYKSLEKGKRLRKNMNDPDIYLEIFFQTKYWERSVQIIPHITIYSKKLKSWQKEHIGAYGGSGVILSMQIGYLGPSENWKDWEVTHTYKEKIGDEIIQYIQQYVVPLIDIFQSRESIIDFFRDEKNLCVSGKGASLLPMSFLLWYSERETVELFLANYAQSCGYRGKIMKLYQDLETQETIDLGYSEFHGASEIKLAYIHGIRLMPENILK